MAKEGMERSVRARGQPVSLWSRNLQLFSLLVTRSSVNVGMELVRARGRGCADWLAAASRARGLVLRRQ